MSDYVDLLISNDDVVLNGEGEPLLITDRDCIAQDVKHLIRDSGLLTLMIGQRDSIVVDDLEQQLALLIEEDERLVPGTVVITQQTNELFFVTATTYKYGVINLELSNA